MSKQPCISIIIEREKKFTLQLGLSHKNRAINVWYIEPWDLQGSPTQGYYQPSPEV